MRSACYENQFSFIFKLELIIKTKVSLLDSLWKRLRGTQKWPIYDWLLNLTLAGTMLVSFLKPCTVTVFITIDSCFVPRCRCQASFFSSLSSFFWMLSSLSFTSIRSSNCALSLYWPVKENNNDSSTSESVAHSQWPLSPPNKRVKRCSQRSPQKWQSKQIGHVGMCSQSRDDYTLLGALHLSDLEA